jgi:hypothetical protein
MVCAEQFGDNGPVHQGRWVLPLENPIEEQIACSQLTRTAISLSPLDLFERRIDARFRDRAYKVEKDPATGKRQLVVDNKPLRLLDAEELLERDQRLWSEGERSRSQQL